METESEQNSSSSTNGSSGSGGSTRPQISQMSLYERQAVQVRRNLCSGAGQDNKVGRRKGGAGWGENLARGSTLLPPSVFSNVTDCDQMSVGFWSWVWHIFKPRKMGGVQPDQTLAL